jgi:predicted dehydrogenase
LKIGIVGCGLIGKRRAQIVRQSPEDQLAMVADVDDARLAAAAQELGCTGTSDWMDIVNNDEIDAVVVATSNKFLMPVAVAALQHGKHVLCEKPPGRNYLETEQMVSAAKKAGRVLKVGFNHRHHPAVWKAHELCAVGEIGPLMFIRAVYGHGGRPGYDKEWRANADLSGGGELLDQGVHIVDLCRWFLGDFHEATGFTGTYFWNLGNFETNNHRLGGSETINPNLSQQQLEDNAFVLLRTLDGQTAQFQTSWTQWKNRFMFEVLGRDGYVRVDGLGGSYGVEKLTIGWRRPESGAPVEEAFEFPGPDISWQAEWQEFTSAVHEGRQPLASGEDGLGTMRTLAAIYESACTGQVVKL